MTLEEKASRVAGIVRGSAPLVIAYSGGVDSTCLLALATQAAGSDVLGVIADSPSLPRAALAEALANARSMGANVEVIATAEFANESYLANPPNRCYFCKSELFSALEAIARARGFQAIAYGENADDQADLRPGSRAAKEFRVLAPLREAGLGKDDVRKISLSLGLPTHDAPSQPCLSSRIPHGTRVTPQALSMVEAGESIVRGLGFRVFRVRYIEGSPPGARVQISRDEMPLPPEMQERLVKGLAGIGFSPVEIDPEGYRTA